MLAGRNDVAPLAYYNPRMIDFSDDGKTLHGAYGYRWWYKASQLALIVVGFQENPNCRRQVLSIWETVEDLATPSKDLPCNTHAYFAIHRAPDGDTLDITVCNRSNDLIWGMLGANAVHFSFLQEYMAACIGIEVGQYHQFTNNLHVYTDRWEPDKWLAMYDHDVYDAPKHEYVTDNLCHVPLVQGPKWFDKECAEFVDSIDGTFSEPFLRDVAQPMCAAFRAHKRRNYRDDNNALRLMERVKADDWRMVGTAWIEKRMKAWEDKSHVKA